MTGLVGRLFVAEDYQPALSNDMFSQSTIHLICHNAFCEIQQTRCCSSFPQFPWLALSSTEQSDSDASDGDNDGNDVMIVIIVMMICH